MKTAAQVKPQAVEKGQKAKGQWRRPKKRYLFAFALLLVSLVGSGFAVVGYQAYNANYNHYLSLARAGMQDLHTAAALLEMLPQDPLGADTSDRAQQQFVAAHTTFVQLDDGLASMPGISALVPIYGARLQTALHLASVAVGLSQAGIVGCAALELLVARFRDPLNSQGHGLTMMDINSIDQDSSKWKAAFAMLLEGWRQVG